MRKMVYGAIAEGGRTYYTDMGEVFAAAGNIQGDYNWLITDWVAYGVDELEAQGGRYCWLTGTELSSLLEKYPDRQWIWGVLSGFDKRVSKEDALKYPLPYADGYEGFWRNPLSLQHPLAEVEIVPWDSTLVLVLGRDQGMVERFRQNFQPSRDLYVYNKELEKK